MFLIVMVLGGIVTTCDERQATRDAAVAELNDRAADSSRVVMLVARDNLSPAQALDADEVVHRLGLGVSHDAAHRMAVDLHLDSAGALLGDSDDERGPHDVAGARRHLGAVYAPLTSAQQDAKAAVEEQTARVQARIEAEVARLAADLMLQQRRAMAVALERDFLDRGFDVTVTTRGKDATTLHIKFILVGKVFAHHLDKNTELKRSLAKAGFTRIVATDGHSGDWTWTLRD